MPSSRKRRSVSNSTNQPPHEDGLDQMGHRTKRHANVFDAVAGRVSTQGFIKHFIYGQNETVLTPEEVLFKSKIAPERTEEDDFYWASRNIEPGSLPDSDLLKTIHKFSSDYYQNTTTDQGQSDMKSLDGSALLALGILLEESASNILGAAGDMAFVEGQPMENGTPTSSMKPDSEGNRIRATSIRSQKSYKRQKRR